MSDRSWAIGMPQARFEAEFVMRNPDADVIPVATEWVKWIQPEYRLVDFVDPDKFESDGEAKNKGGDQFKKHLGFPCRGCGKVFDYKVARAGHERWCKNVLKNKLDAREEKVKDANE